jgi:hypothetical protein
MVSGGGVSVIGGMGGAVATTPAKSAAKAAAVLYRSSRSLAKALLTTG